MILFAFIPPLSTVKTNPCYLIEIGKCAAGLCPNAILTVSLSVRQSCGCNHVTGGALLDWKPLTKGRRGRVKELAPGRVGPKCFGVWCSYSDSTLPVLSFEQVSDAWVWGRLL